MRFPMLYPASLLLAGVALPLPLAAQEVVQPLPGTTDADRLADLVRQIGRNPRDVSALVDAGDLSAKLGDTTAAASLYKRASQVDPNNARVQAGIARILVNGEHPGEALRYFGQAERAGLSPGVFADDRGLAYDLIGEQERAQRDYRVALARGGQDNEDEVRRRYALSLGISGRKDEALQQIDTLLRKSDRGAWRARAFILAMNGDAAGANKIATTMMPAGMAGGLAAFFTRLPTLSPADRAFAVHFGEVTPTPERLADARLVPPLPAMAPDAYARAAGVQIAQQAAANPRAVPDRRRDARVRSSADTRTQPGEQVASATTRVAASNPLSMQRTHAAAHPAYAAQPSGSAAYTAGTSLAAAVEARTTVPAANAPVTMAATTPGRSPASTVPQSVVGVRTLSAGPVSARTAASPATAAGTSSVTAGQNSAAQANAAVRAQSTPVATQFVTSDPSPALGNPTGAASTAMSASGTVPSSGTVATTPATASTASPVQLAAATPLPQPMTRAPATPPRIENEDTILARIVANISIPASELEVAPMPAAAPQPKPGATATIDQAALVAEQSPAAIERRRDRATDGSAARHPRHPAAGETVAADPASGRDKPVVTARGTKASGAPATAGRTRRGGKAHEDVAQADADQAPATTGRGTRRKGEPAESKLTPKQAAAKARADAKALAEAKAAAAEKKAARAEPERYWVQVAGGATQNDLNKAWKNVRTKSSLLATRAGYTTPLRATNRVVTGPFKTQDEAQAMVNRLSKDGVSAFTFTSEAGQKMTKLGEK